MKLAPLPTIISTPPPPKQALKTTDIPAIRKQASPVYTGNPITHSEEKVSRLELIRKRRSRENVHSIEETVDKNEQYVDTFQHGVKPVTIADSVENVRCLFVCLFTYHYPALLYCTIIAIEECRDNN